MTVLPTQIDLRSNLAKTPNWCAGQAAFQRHPDAAGDIERTLSPNALPDLTWRMDGCHGTAPSIFADLNLSCIHLRAYGLQQGFRFELAEGVARAAEALCQLARQSLVEGGVLHIDDEGADILM